MFNKVDLLLEEEVEALCESIKEKLDWDGPVYQISAFQKMNTQQLCHEIMNYIETLPAGIDEDDEKETVEFKWDSYDRETMQGDLDDDLDDDDDWDEDDYDVEVEYRR